MSRIIKHSESDIEGVDAYERETLAAQIIAEVEGEEVAVEVVDPEVERAAILSAARDEAELKVREAYEEGLRRGEAKAIEEFKERAGEAAAVFEEASQAIRLARENFVEQLSPQIVAITRAIAEQVTRRECQTDSDMITRVAREALAQAASAQSVSIHVNPADYEIVKEHKPELIEGFTRIEEVHLIADETIDRGGCQIDAATTIVDASLEAMIARALEALDG